MSSMDRPLTVSRFYIADMCCPTEEQMIRNCLRKMEGVAALEFDIVQRRLTVNHEPGRAEAVQAAVASIGMEPVRLEDGASATPEPTLPIDRLREWGPIALSGLAALGAEVVTWRTGTDDDWPAVVLAVVSIALGGPATLRKGWAALRTLTLNINLLMTIAVVGAILIGHWPEAAMVTFLFGLAEMIEGLSLDRARNAIRGADGADAGLGQHTAIPLAVGTRFRPPRSPWDRQSASGQGERIPLDGVIRVGQSAINQAPITGESLAVDKHPGDQVFAGTINENGVLEVEVTATQGDTTLARIIRNVQEAQAKRAPTQRTVDQFARYYTPVVVILAMLMASDSAAGVAAADANRGIQCLSPPGSCLPLRAGAVHPDHHRERPGCRRTARHARQGRHLSGTGAQDQGGGAGQDRHPYPREAGGDRGFPAERCSRVRNPAPGGQPQRPLSTPRGHSHCEGLPGRPGQPHSRYQRSRVAGAWRRRRPERRDVLHRQPPPGRRARHVFP